MKRVFSEIAKLPLDRVGVSADTGTSKDILFVTREWINLLFVHARRAGVNRARS